MCELSDFPKIRIIEHFVISKFLDISRLQFSNDCGSK